MECFDFSCRLHNSRKKEIEIILLKWVWFEICLKLRGVPNKLNVIKIRLEWKIRDRQTKQNELEWFLHFPNAFNRNGIGFCQRTKSKSKPRLVSLDGCSQIHLGIPKFAWYWRRSVGLSDGSSGAENSVEWGVEELSSHIGSNSRLKVCFEFL